MGGIIMSKDEFIKWVKENPYYEDEIEFKIGVEDRWVVTVWANGTDADVNDEYIIFNDLEGEGRAMIMSTDIDYVNYNDKTYGYNIHLKGGR